MKPVKYIKEKIIKQNPVAGIFTLMMAISAVIFFLVYLIVGNGRFVDIFFLRCSDVFMDFFNSIRDAAQGEEVYTVRNVIYPPMANLIFLILSRFTPGSYNNTTFSNRQEWTEYPSPTMLVFLFFLICAMMLFYVIFRFVEGNANQKFFFALFATVSVPTLYMMERGNLIILCLISLIVFCATYNSKSRASREIGLIALAFTFSLKLYPVLFGWFLLVDKRFKDALRCFIYGMLMLILPSFLFGGPGCLIHVFKNIFGFSSGSGGSTVSSIAGYLHIPISAVNLVAYLWCFVCVICLLISPYVHKERWKSWLIGCLLILLVPSLTSLYSWAFIIIPVIMLSNNILRGKETLTRKNIAYLILMSVPFIFLPGRFTFYVSTNTFAVYIFTAVLSIYTVIDTFICLKQFLKKNKALGISLISVIKNFEGEKI